MFRVCKGKQGSLIYFTMSISSLEVLKLYKAFGDKSPRLCKSKPLMALNRERVSSPYADWPSMVSCHHMNKVGQNATRDTYIKVVVNHTPRSLNRMVKKMSQLLVE